MNHTLNFIVYFWFIHLEITICARQRHIILSLCLRGALPFETLLMIIVTCRAWIKQLWLMTEIIGHWSMAFIIKPGSVDDHRTITIMGGSCNKASLEDWYMHTSQCILHFSSFRCGGCTMLFVYLSSFILIRGFQKWPGFHESFGELCTSNWI